MLFSLFAPRVCDYTLYNFIMLVKPINLLYSKAMKRLEDQIHFACAQWLRENNILFFHPPNEGKRTIREATRLKALGLVSGVPDLVILLDNAVTVFVELKTQKGKNSNSQNIFQAKLLKKGFRLYTIQTDCPVEAARLLSQIYNRAIQETSQTPTQ